MQESDTREKVVFEKIFLELDPSNYRRSDASRELTDAQLELLPDPTYEKYRFWHDEVGRPFGWHERPRINDKNSIEELLGNPKVQMFLLKVGDEEVGYALIEEDKQGAVEISDFGFPPDKVGQGYGSVFFPLVLDEIIKSDIKRIWLSTRSTNDPKVVDFYEKFGLKVYNREKVEEFKA